MKADFPYTQLQIDWINKLKDPSLKQIKDYLATDEGHCCLGIACEFVLKLEKIEGTDYYNPSLDSCYYFGNNRIHKSLGIDLQKDLNLRNCTGEINYTKFPFELNKFDDQQNFLSSLTNLNDSGWSFEDIAYLMEEYPEAIFTNLEE